ncbi:hypothetical protein WDL1CHR_01159 [Variovorax sp. WDL1]|uniref:hypothetical protein n=1 Tax=Variovorax sp. WDL1 TaxID=207745 RepID=UPI000CAA62A1|nr:hypothetical protein [Variovorax sp. WDL1]PNG56054.1 hypothetical protein CHC07_02468 [Variovorax sp. B4]PNG57478.1 hypothetical protein CHC06_02471 [Variovorax sp. B2]VTV10140.1 hypothetical protein WDL1CHR_01159 [Variovorax sp. WDL1]
MADLRSELKRLRDQIKTNTRESTTPPNKQPTPRAMQVVLVTPLRRAAQPPRRVEPPAQPPVQARRPQPHTQATRPPAQQNRHASPVAPPRPPQPASVPTIYRPLPQKALTRRDRFLRPEAWVAAGGKTQYMDSGHHGAVDIYIGLDFGTSFTKAAVGFKDKIYPVSWSGMSKTSPDYLLPSEFTEFEDGSLFVGQHPDADVSRVRGDLKLPFLNPAVSTSSITTAATFIALVLRYIRAWVYQYHGATLGASHLRWQLNIGAPSNGPDDARLVQAYWRLAAMAWRRSIECNVTRLALDDGTPRREGEQLQDLVDLQVHAEFVAQMAGYMQSPQRQRGLHALVDVGGGSLDVVTFIVHRVEEEDTFPFLVPQVHPLGTHGILQNRLVGGKLANGTGVIDGLAPVPSVGDFAKATGLSEAHVSARDTLYEEKFRAVIRSVFDTTKARRYRLSDAWQTGVRTFFTGGGSGTQLCHDALHTASVPSAKGLHMMPLPAHRNLDGFEGAPEDYQRISVACGLAQDAFTLGRIVPAKEVDDDVAPTWTTATARPDRDDLYPK